MPRLRIRYILVFLLCMSSQPILAQYTIWYSPLTFSTDQAQLTIKQDLNLVDFRLKQNYPNPFNPSTTIDYEVQKTTTVRIDIFNSMGQRLRRLVDAVKLECTYPTGWGCKPKMLDKDHLWL